MATGNSDGSIVLNTKVDTGGLQKGFVSIAAQAKKMGSTVGKAFFAIGAAATVATVAIIKSSVDAYAEYEQLVGGVETLFKNSSKKVLEYANEAYKTAGLSANEYMQNVTAFSASLLDSLGGDTEQAAEVANAAIISISDNVNKMGSDYASVQNAFQGFAKQQYMLLDNLKLGYGGTKTEMERLLKDAEAYRASMGETVSYEISNLADVYTAIGDIQKKLDIAGTTALEAEGTISGSAATMNAAWRNVLTAISGGGDLNRAINNLVDSISNYFKNIVPVVEKSLSGIGKLIEKIAPMLVQTVAKSLIKAIPGLLNAVYEMIIGLAKGIYQGIIDLFSGASNKTLTEQAQNIKQSVKNQNDLTAAVEKTNKAMNKTTAKFDTIEILSAKTTKNASVEPIIPEISISGLGESLKIEESKKELSTFEKILEQSFDKISKIIKKAWGSKPVQAFWETVKSTSETSLYAFETIGASLWKNLKTTWGNIEHDFDLMTSNMSDLWTNFWQDFQMGIDTWGQPIIDGVNNLFNSIWTSAIDPYIQLMAGAWSDFTSILKSKWEEYGQQLIDNIGQFVKNIVTEFRSLYDNIIEPIITPFLEELNWLWDNYLSKFWEKISNFVLKLTNAALEIYNKFIHPLILMIVEHLAPTFSFFSSFVSGTIGTLVALLSNNIGAMLDFFGGLIDFILGVFTGDWKRAWEGVKSIFKGIFDSLVGIIKTPINLIIDAINALISGINKVSFDLPDWPIFGNMAGKKFGFDIPKIPKLAKGAVIPPNREFLAVLGDQKYGKNIEAPLATIQDAVKNVTEQQNDNLRELLYLSIEVQREILEAVLGIQIGDDIIGKASQRYNNSMIKIYGG